MKSADVIAILKANGWELIRVKGSHHQFGKGGVTVPVPHPKKDLRIGLVKSIERSTGLKIWR